MGRSVSSTSSLVALALLALASFADGAFILVGGPPVCGSGRLRSGFSVGAGGKARKFGWGWVTYADIHDGDANERWHLDNAIYDVRSPYFRDDRDDALFFNACESLFLPREYAALRAKYSALDVDAA